MKRNIASALAFASIFCATAFAQPKAGTFSVIPKVGLSGSMMSGDNEDFTAFGVLDFTRYEELKATLSYNDITEDMYYNLVVASCDDPKSGIGFSSGVDFQYQLSRRWAVTTGFNYSYRRNDYGEGDEPMFLYLQNFDWETKSLTYKLHYLQIPLSAKFYVYNGLSLNAGVQVGLLRQAYCEYKGRVRFYNSSKFGILDIMYGDYEKLKWYDAEAEARVSDDMNRFAFSIPVGLSYEFGNVVTDFRADIGLSNIFDDNDIKRRNSAFTVSVGYRFDL